MKTHLLLATAVGAFVSLGAIAGHADVIWNFDSPPGDLGLTNTYASNPILSPPQNITATAFTPSSNPGHLFGKNAGPGEQGLGLTNNGEDEITQGSFVQLNISGLSVPPLGGLTMSFQAGSTTGGEEWAVYGTNTAGTSGSGAIPGGAVLLASGFNDNLDPNIGSVIGTYKYLDVTELASVAGGNILISELDAPTAAVPEPASLGLLGEALAGMGVLWRRRSPRA